MAEGLRQANERMLEIPTLLQCQKDIRDLADELIGPPPGANREYGMPNRYPEIVRAELLDTNLKDALLNLEDPLHPHTMASYGAVPSLLFMTSDSKYLQSTDIGAWRTSHPKIRYVQPEQVGAIGEDEPVMTFPLEDGSTYVEWPHQRDWESGVFVRFNWKRGIDQIQETISLETHENDPGALPILTSKITFRTTRYEDFMVWRKSVQPVIGEVEANYMLAAIKDLYGSENLFD